jgi:hypothetical protein
MKTVIQQPFIFLLTWTIFRSINCHGSITFPNAPEDGREFAYKLVSELLRADTNVFNGLQIQDLTITNSSLTYSVGKQDIISGTLLSTAKPTGWHYLFMHGTNLIAFVPLTVNPAGKIIEKSGVFMDSDDQTMKAINSAQGLAQVGQQDYELRYLAVDLSFRMIWLHGKTNDIIIPMEPTYGKMTDYHPYSEAQMIGILKPYLKQERKVNALVHSNAIEMQTPSK